MTMAIASPVATSRSTRSTPATSRFPSDPGYFGHGGSASRPTRTFSGATTSTSTPARTSPRARRWCTSRPMRPSAPRTTPSTTATRRSTASPARTSVKVSAMSFAVRYVNGGAFDGGTSLLTWRDAKRHITPFNCALDYPGSVPARPEPGRRVRRRGELRDAGRLHDFALPDRRGSSSPSRGRRSAHWSAARLCRPAMTSAGSILNLNSTVAGSLVPFEPLMQNWVTVTMDARWSLQRRLRCHPARQRDRSGAPRWIRSSAPADL